MKILEHLEDSIQNWQHKVREITGEVDFRAIPYLAEECGVTKGTFYKWLEGDLNRCKIGLADFKKIVIATNDIELLDAFCNEVKGEIKIKSKLTK